MGRSECIKLGPLAWGTIGNEEYGNFPSQPGRSSFENIDAANYPSGTDYDNGQSAYLTAPTSIDSDNTDSAFLNNVKTNSDFVLQNGLYFDGTSGLVVWTSGSVDYYPQEVLATPYQAGHQYWFVISYSSMV